MKISWQDNRIAYGKIDPGGVFEYKGEIYMKLHQECSNANFNSIKLRNGASNSFADKVEVIPLDAELIIKVRTNDDQ